MNHLEPNEPENWSVIREKILNFWTRIEAAELDETHGDKKEIEVLLNKKYGTDEFTYNDRLHEIYNQAIPPALNPSNKNQPTQRN